MKSRCAIFDGIKTDRGFSGWWVLAVAGLALFWSGPSQTYGVSSFVEPMLDDLEMPRSMFSLYYSVGTMFSAIALIPLGRVIDRWGTKRSLLVSSVGLVAALLFASTMRGPLMVLVAFAFLRTMGAGLLPLAARTLVPFWFVQRRGRAFSLLGLATTLSVATIPAVGVFLIDRMGWRAAWRWEALAIALILIPAIAFIVHDRPEDVGQRADGEPPEPEDAPVSRSLDWGPTLHEAMRTPIFWAMVLAGAIPALVLTGVSFNQVSLFEERGMSAGLAAATFTVESMVALPMALFAGWLVDRKAPRYAIAVSEVLFTITLIWLLFADTPTSALTYAAWRGAAVGLWMVAMDVAWPAVFGRRHLGAIRGFGNSAGIAAAALGPLPIGFSHDLFGSYSNAIVVLAVLPLIPAVWILVARGAGSFKPQDPEPQPA